MKNHGTTEKAKAALYVTLQKVLHTMSLTITKQSPKYNDEFNSEVQKCLYIAWSNLCTQ